MTMKIKIEIEGDFESLSDALLALQAKTVTKVATAVQKIETPPVPVFVQLPEPKILPKFSKIHFQEYLPDGQNLTQFALAKFEEGRKLGKDVDEINEEIKNLSFGYVRDKRPDFNTTVLSQRIYRSMASIKSKYLTGKLTPESDLDDSGNAPIGEVAEAEEEEEGKVGFSEAGV